MLQVPEGYSLNKAQEGIDLVNDSDNLWVLKSDGQSRRDDSSKTKDVRLNHMQIGALKADAKDYEEGG